MSWFNRVLSKVRWKLVRGEKFPKANLLSCLLNLSRRGFQPREIIDVGAHKAKWSRVAHRVFPSAGYTLIEPIAELQPYLERFCRGRENRRFLAAGVGEVSGELEFTIYPERTASSFVVHHPAKRKLGTQRMVPVVTLDDVVAEHIGRIPDIVKVDAEGFETQVVNGGQTLLGHTELFFLEAHFFGPEDDPSMLPSLVRFMDERDYVPYDFTWFGKRQFDGAVMLCEIAFARRNGLLRSLSPDRKEIRPLFVETRRAA